MDRQSKKLGNVVVGRRLVLPSRRIKGSSWLTKLRRVVFLLREGPHHYAADQDAAVALGLMRLATNMLTDFASPVATAQRNGCIPWQQAQKGNSRAAHATPHWDLKLWSSSFVLELNV